jgi:hypothetical protein
MTKDEVIALFTDDVEVRKLKVREYIMDITNSYEDRYQVWKTTPDHLMSNDAWVAYLRVFDKKWGKISWYDDFYCERYSNVDLRSCAESGFENDWPEDQLKDFITECMDNGWHGFYYDW